MPAQEITWISGNIEKGANLEAAAGWLVEQRPDVFFMQELQPGQKPVMEKLTGMTGYTAVRLPTSPSTNSTAIFLRDGGPMVFAEEYAQSWAPWQAPANIAVRLRDADGTLSPRAISLVSAHLCYWSPDLRLVEAQWFHTLAKPGWLAAVFSDWNSYRAGEGGPWAGYEDMAYVANRTYLDAAGERRSDDRPDREMTAAGYVEMARWAAERLGQPHALRPTTGHRHHPGRPISAPRHCIDRGYLTRELAPALISYEVCDTPPLRLTSDHLPPKAVLDRNVLREILHRPTKLYQPHKITTDAAA